MPRINAARREYIRGEIADLADRLKRVQRDAANKAELSAASIDFAEASATREVFIKSYAQAWMLAEIDPDCDHARVRSQASAWRSAGEAACGQALSAPARLRYVA